MSAVHCQPSDTTAPHFMSDMGKAMDERARGELADRIASESQDVIASATIGGMFVLPLSTTIATGRA